MLETFFCFQLLFAPYLPLKGVLVVDMVTILVALGLAIDSFSVSITRGLTTKTRLVNEALTVACFFGFFQAIMPVIGWLAGVSISDFVSSFDHWITFGILVFIGLRMIYESTKNESTKIVSSPRISVMIMLSIAISIDALALGLSLSFLEVGIFVPATIIGIITFSLSFLGVYIGERFRGLQGKMGMLGGVILVIIGVRILIEHLGILL